MSVKKLELDKIWQTWIKIGNIKSIRIDELSFLAQKIIREKVVIFSKLLAEKKIDWYCFLIHTSPIDKDSCYFHVRFTKKDENNLELPEFCSEPELEKLGKKISGIDESILKNEDIREVWKIIGEQSELIIKILQIHKEEIPNQQFVQFMHFNMNMLGLGMRSHFDLQEGFVHRTLRF